MFLSKTPLRVSFLGGGTDFPWFFEAHGGAVISAAISQHIFISALPSFDERSYYLKYSKLEVVENLADISHPIFRTALSKFGRRPLDIAVMAEIPAGNGLASSSAFTVGLINLLNRESGVNLDQAKLARLAIELELDELREPIGIQDQLASSFGGVYAHTFSSGRKIESKVLFDASNPLPFRFFLVKVGNATRSASHFTQLQASYVSSSQNALTSLLELRDLTYEAIDALQSRPSLLPHYMRLGWELKIKSNPSALSAEISKMTNALGGIGALATKLLGAGGGGFVLAVFDPGMTHDQVNRLASMGKVLEVSVDYEGAKTWEV